MRLPVRSKALAYVIRWRDGRPQLLVFERDGHPQAGVQIPAGTVDPGERSPQACVREVFEETGVTVSAAPRAAGRFSYVHAVKREYHLRHVFVLDAPEGLPETWTHTVTGRGRDRGRRHTCRWLDAQVAARTLAMRQGAYIPRALGHGHRP